MFKTIDKIYVINLAKSKDRLEKFDKQAKEYGIEYERYKAVKHKIGSWGCAQSHTNIIKDAKEKGYKRIMIFEDDALFLYPKEYVKEHVNKFIKERFDIGYIGGNFAWDGENDFEPETLDCRCLGRFAVIINHTAYDYLINNHPTLQQFKSDRLKRGDVSYCHSPLIKKCMRYPVVGVDNKETFTYTNCEETKKPLSFGCEHYSLILSSYFAKDMVDKSNIKVELVYKLFAESNRCVKYANVIKANTRDINPFDFIEVRTINLDTDIDRWIKMTKMFDEYGITCNRFKAIKNSNGWGGSTVSHRQCVVEAKEQHKPKVLIFEDDVYFLYPKSQVWADIRNIIGMDYDIAYLGCTLLEPAPKIPQTNNIYKVNKCWGVWAYIVDQSIYDEFIDLLPSDPTIVSRKKRNISDVLVHDYILPKGRCLLTPIMSSYDGYSYNWEKQRSDTQNMINSAYKKYLVNYNYTPEFYIKTENVLEISIPLPTVIHKQPTTKKPPQKIITTQPEKGNIYVISSQETSRQLKTIQDSIKEFNIIEPTPLDFPEVLNLSYMFEQKLKHDKREIAKKKKEISYSITIRNIIKKAKENNFRKVIVFQDGITFDKDPNTIIPQLEELPENFGVCFLGGYFRKPFLGSFYDYNEHFLELKGSFKIWGTHAIVIGQEIYDVLIKALTINFDKNFQELLCSIIVGKYPSYTYNLPFVFYDEHFSNRYSINNVPVKTLKQDNSNIIKKSKNNK